MAKRSKIESILCSAIWYKNLPLVNEEVLRIRGFSPYNVNTGIVFCGWRHPNCLYQMVAITGLSQYQAGEEEQGFLTNKNRFVDREEGAKIALESKQIKKLQFSSNLLYSEDLY
jgi:hypothetical protein